MKAQKDLRSAILNCLTPDQQKELANLITEMAESAKNYGMDVSTENKDVSDSLIRANRAWNELRYIGLETRF